MPTAPHQSLADELVERAERLLERHVGVGPVHLVQVDAVGAQPAQAVGDRFAHPSPRAAAVLRIVVHRVAELGRQHDSVAAAGEELAEHVLRHAEVVDVGGVDERDAGVERHVEHLPALVAVGVAPRAEHHRSQPERADFDARRTQPTNLHPGSLTSRFAVWPKR